MLALLLSRNKQKRRKDNKLREKVILNKKKHINSKEEEIHTVNHCLKLLKAALT